MMCKVKDCFMQYLMAIHLTCDMGQHERNLKEHPWLKPSNRDDLGSIMPHYWK